MRTKREAKKHQQYELLSFVHYLKKKSSDVDCISNIASRHVGSKYIIRYLHNKIMALK